VVQFWSWRCGQVDLLDKDQRQYFPLETNAIMSKYISFHRFTTIRSIFITNKSGNRRFDKSVDSSYNTRCETTECYLSSRVIEMNCVFMFQNTVARVQPVMVTHNPPDLCTLCGEINSCTPKSFLNTTGFRSAYWWYSCSKCNIEIEKTMKPFVISFKIRSNHDMNVKN